VSREDDAQRYAHEQVDALDPEAMKEGFLRLERRMRHMFEAAVDGIVILLKPTAELLQYNDVFADMVGLEPAPLFSYHGREGHSHGPLLGYLHDDDKTPFVECFEKHCAGRLDDPRLRVRLRRQDGAVLRCALTFHRLSGGSRVSIMFVRDLTEQLHARQQIEAYSKQLEARNAELRDTQAQLVQQGKMAALGTLVAGVAHDINTPLGSVKANGELAKTIVEKIRKFAPDDNPKLERTVSALDEAMGTLLLATKRIATIVNSLRKFARLDEAELKEVDLHEGLDSSILLVSHMLEHRVRIETDFGELPAVRCHPGEINQVFMNLLTNAVQAIDGNGVVTVRTRHHGDTVAVEICDDGVGIAPDDLTKLFDPGYTTKGVGVGTGLGLAIAYRIADDHGGSISVESTLGEGTAFRVTLPCVRAD
jgi:PAS domain S-box-containing protein